jgi:hypothetical protein
MNFRPIIVGLTGCMLLTSCFAAAGQDWSWPGWGYGCQSTYSIDAVPYFALHPPVYYSYRVARTYGYGPFPYPPGVMTPGSEPPRTVQNVYAPSSETPADSQQGRPPLRIDNPYVEQPGGPGVAKLQKPAARKPQVVYPAALARAGD